MCVYIYVCGGCLDKHISAAAWPPKQNFLTPPLFEWQFKMCLNCSSQNHKLVWLVKFIKYLWRLPNSASFPIRERRNLCHRDI